MLKILKVFLPSAKFQMDETLGQGKMIENLKDRLSKKRWEGVEAKLDTLSPAELNLFMGEVTSIENENRDILYEWYEARPEAFYPTLLLGKLFISLGWEARGSGLASTVTEAMAEEFYHCLGQAYVLLENAIEIQPKHIEPYHQLLIMGKAYPNIDVKVLRKKANEINPNYIFLHTAIISDATERWGGKKGEALTYAQSICNTAPKGSSLHGLMASAHIEAWVDISNPLKAMQYFKNTMIQNDIFTAYQEAFPEQKFRDDIESLDMLNDFAVCFYLSKKYDIVKTILQFLEQRSREYPWIYLDETFLGWIDVNYHYSSIHKSLKV